MTRKNKINVEGGDPVSTDGEKSPALTGSSRTYFKKGQSGNPKGREKGSRNKLGEMFLTDLQTAWDENGKSVLKDAIAESPIQFAKMIASILPKELLISKAPTEEMTDDDLRETIASLGQWITEHGQREEGLRATHEGTGPEGKPQ